MNEFKNYKKDANGLKGFCQMIFGTRVQRIFLSSFIAFVFGVVLTTGVLSLSKRVLIKRGVGGLETAGVPAFSESDFENSAISPISNDGFADTEMSSLSEELDDLDSAANILDEENQGSDKIELCYYTYRVKKGDMIGYIADSFNITQDTIISVNNIHQSRLLQIGQYLKIPSMPGIVYTVRSNGETLESIAEKYEVSAEKCARVNSIQSNVSLHSGTSVFIPDAQLDWVTRQEINGDLFHKPLHARYWLSSYYGWRSSPFSGKRSYHSGIDMAAPQGTPIYAALGGTVSSVGYNNVYGNYVIITHHSGYKTLYGHMSATLVTRGQYVSTDTRIGRVGNTGMSTGPHLHFTVYKFGKTVDPLSLLK